MVTKFKLKDEVYLENNPDQVMSIAYIDGNKIHCIAGNNKQVIVDVTELIKYNPVPAGLESELN